MSKRQNAKLTIDNIDNIDNWHFDILRNLYKPSVRKER